MRNNNLQINNTTLSIKEWNGQRVVSFKDIDLVHKRPDGTARKAFNRNRKHLVENEDYFIIKPKDVDSNIRCKNINIKELSPRGAIHLTNKGYLLLISAFDDELTWIIKRELFSKIETDVFDLIPNISIEKDNSGYIYMAIDPLSKHIKIGKTSCNVANRISSLNCGRTTNIEDYYEFFCTNIHIAEKEIHKRLENMNIKGEWFNISKKEAINIINDTINSL